MQRRIVLGLCAYGLLLLGLALRDGRFIILGLPLWLYLGMALLRYPDLPTLAVNFSVQQPVVTERSPVTVNLSLRNEDRRTATFLVEVPSPEGLVLRFGAVRCLARLAPQETLVLSYEFDTRRGRFDFPDVQATTEEPSGVFGRTLTLQLHSRLLVLPQVQPLRPVTMRPKRTQGFTGPIPARQGGVGLDIYGVREYQSGDPLRRINWRATARYHDRAFTTEFELERITDVGLILDVRRQTSLQANGEMLLDHSVRAAAALAARFLRDGHRVGLLSYGEGNQWVFPGYGRVQRMRILRALAAAAPAKGGFFDSLNFLSARVFPAHCQLIFISPLASDDHEMLFRLRARGYSVLVLSPDPLAFEAAAEAPPSPLALRLARVERTLLLHRLRQGGILAVDWSVNVALEERLAPIARRAAHSGANRWLM